jgi:signal transduction histidine kinase
VIAFGHAVLTGHRRLAVGTLIGGYLTFPWVGWIAGTGERPTLGYLVGLGAWLLVIISVAETVRSRRERAQETTRVREEALLRRATDERLRIARELHDVVAHNMSLINLQAGVALHLLDERAGADGAADDGALPAEVRHALATIKSASKEALIEMRSILGVLRQVDEDAPRAPTPGLDALPGLVERAEAAGLRVRIEADADLGAVPRNVELAAFRIVQEALTNVARHAAQADTVVRLRSHDGVLTVDVLDEGAGRATTGSILGTGSGIPGMRERAASVGGALEAGPRPGRGFAVHAELPLEGRQ